MVPIKLSSPDSNFFIVQMQDALKACNYIDRLWQMFLSEHELFLFGPNSERIRASFKKG